MVNLDFKGSEEVVNLKKVLNKLFEKYKTDITEQQKVNLENFYKSLEIKPNPKPIEEPKTIE
jgi:hypothetical protein